ncbi:prepilin peptidase [Streptomyces mexicanus]|uniref:Prepilin peptidase n=1 Tax=Streptomyces mexicanus TaxID=178566 RepID=A0A7X1LSM5_9ACTN|nr:A24 family peptidase [Streptomyces mexicanus]MBC2868268.1 prepilin peptidase [Streptomyces mexicanus]
MRVLLIALALLWGAGAGLLVPRAVHRFAVEAGEPWRAECPGGHPITGAFGGWVGRARCPGPGGRGTGSDGSGSDGSGGGGTGRGGAPCAAYGPSTPAVAAVTALVCAALAAATGPRPEAVVWSLVAPVGVLLALVDQRVHRLPDVLTLPLAALTAVLLGGAALLPAAAGSWPGVLLGAVVLGGAYFLLFLVNPSGLGFGDVKLALALGAALGWYGWPVVVAGAVAGLLYGGCYGLGLILLRRAGRGAVMPLGPFMLGGAFTGLLLGASTAA